MKRRSVVVAGIAIDWNFLFILENILNVVAVCVVTVIKRRRGRRRAIWALLKFVFVLQIEEKIKDYKISLTEIKEEEVKRQMEIVIDDLESILYG